MVLLEGYDALSTDTLKKQYIKELKILVNTWVLGSLTHPANWEFIVDQTFPNGHVCKFMLEFQIIAPFCMAHDEVRQAKWDDTIHQC
jgi:hypothetical protein